MSQRWAPETDVGPPKIIPSRGPHDVIYPRHEQYVKLVKLGLLSYTPEYGPHARVYRPTIAADTATVKRWLAGDITARLV